MAAKLAIRLVEKPWGRDRLPAMFGETGGRRVGEAWFEGAGDLPLLVKYIFTSERLSIQVHPDEAQARALGLPNGKSECWFILDAEPGAALGLGLRRPVDAAALRAAALDGSIEQLMDWRPVRAGDFFYVPAGTVHAIGAGITLIEFQQNSDVTYRLYDYGRPRELHLDEAVAVARAEPYAPELSKTVDPGATSVLVDGPHFTLAHVAGAASCFPSRRRWVMPLEGRVRSGSVEAAPGDCLLLEAGDELEADGARFLIGVDGPLD